MGASTPVHVLECDAGLEEIVVAELAEHGIEGRKSRIPGRVIAESPVDAAPTTVRHVLDRRIDAHVDTLDDVRECAAAADIPELADTASFRVTSHDLGDPPFDKIALQGAVGAALVKKYGTNVDLEDYETEVRADIFGRRLCIGLQHTRTSLDERIRRGKSLKGSLRPTVAAAMLRIAGAHQGPGRLLDPMCGAGVIPVEASRNAGLEVFAGDREAATVEIANATFRNHGLDLLAELRDARTADGRTYDYIVSDPPHGLRLGRRTPLTALYAEILSASREMLAPGGKIVWIVVKHRVLDAAVERSGLRVFDRRVLTSGQLRRQIVTLVR